MIIDPRGFGDDVIAWADQMSFLIARQTSPFFRLDDPTEWRVWARSIYRQPNRVGQAAPDPDAYDTWQDWAERFFETSDFLG